MNDHHRSDTTKAHVIVLVDTEHHVLSIDSARGIVRYTRTSVPFTVEGLDAAFATVIAAFAKVDRENLRLLVDMRQVPFYGNEALETAMRERVQFLLDGFARRAMLVRTAVGVLQVNRLSKDSPQPPAAREVFRDEAEAIAWLTS